MGMAAEEENYRSKRQSCLKAFRLARHHPQRRTHRDTGEECPDGDGLVNLFRNRSRYLFRCGKCKRSNLNGLPMRLLIDLEARGYSLKQAGRESEGAQRAFNLTQIIYKFEHYRR